MFHRLMSRRWLGITAMVAVLIGPRALAGFPEDCHFPQLRRRFSEKNARATTASSGTTPGRAGRPGATESAPGATEPGTDTGNSDAFQTPPLADAENGLDLSEGESGASGLGGVLGGNESLPNIIGDMSPVQGLVHINRASAGFPSLPGQLPPNAPTGTPARSQTSIFSPSARGIKISENQSPLPQDRVFGAFNYYQNVSADYNTRDQSQYSNLRVYHQSYGAEKTFLDGNASLGLRVPINTLTLNSPNFGAGGTHTGTGDMTFYGKYILAETTWSDNRAFYLTTGLSITAPTGPRSFAAYPTYVGESRFQGFRSTYIQPFLGYVFTNNNFFFQGISAIEAPTGSGGKDVTMIFNDLGIGYFVYKNRVKDAFITAIVPTFETHINTPLNHRGYHANDMASTPDSVDLTLGINLEVRRNTLLTFGCAAPVTGPQQFDYELIGLLNIRFGRGGSGGLGQVPLQPLQQ